MTSPAPVVLKAKPEDFRTKDETEKQYWIGIISEAPIDVVTVGGFSFAKRRNKRVSAAGQSKMENHPMTGQVVRVNEDDLKNIEKGMREKYLRKYGNGWKVHTKNSRARENRTLKPSDVLLGEICFMIEVEKSGNPPFTDNTPRPLIKREEVFESEAPALVTVENNTETVEHDVKEEVEKDVNEEVEKDVNEDSKEKTKKRSRSKKKSKAKS